MLLSMENRFRLKKEIEKTIIDLDPAEPPKMLLVMLGLLYDLEELERYNIPVYEKEDDEGPFDWLGDARLSDEWLISLRGEVRTMQDVVHWLNTATKEMQNLVAQLKAGIHNPPVSETSKKQ